MMLKTSILSQYKLPYEVRGCLAISSELCVVLGAATGDTGRLLLLKSGEIDVLDYEIPMLKFGHFNYRGALYKTDTGFGCVLDNELVEYNLSQRFFKISPIKGAVPTDEYNRETGPLGVALKMSKKELLVTMEDHFHKFKGRYLTKLNVGFTGIRRSPFLFSMKKMGNIMTMDCSATFVDNRIIFHRCEYGKMLSDNPSDISELCEIRNGQVKVISEISKGIGRFSSDREHLLIKTYSKPYSLQFYSMVGEKLFEIPLTPKKVTGEIDKRFLQFFDKFDDKLWMGRNDVVTETKIQSG